VTLLLSLRSRLNRLERDAKWWDLVCPVCGWRVILYGDVPLQLLALDWAEAQPEGRGADWDPNLLALAHHEHPARDFVEKRSGQPLSAVSGLGEVLPE
jgi:hypothetical protein